MARQRGRFGRRGSRELDARSTHPPRESRETDPSEATARRPSRRGVRVARRVARRRRDPETARQEILDAAERVFAAAHPDRVGLKEVAREAGVSHALITHYFGTYGGLVEATLERRIRGLRARMMARMLEAGALARPGELLGMLFDALDDPVHLRLMKWMVANERQTSAHALALQERGVQLIARQVAEALVPKPAEAMIVTIELALVTAVSAAFGWAMSKIPLAASIGRSPTPALQSGIRTTLAGMVQTYLRATIGPMIPGGLPLGEEPHPLENIGPRDDD